MDRFLKTRHWRIFLAVPCPAGKPDGASFTRSANKSYNALCTSASAPAREGRRTRPTTW